MRPDAARLQALRMFGGVEPTKEACRDARGTALLDNVVRDVRYACRSFRRAPLVALTIVTTVGLGLGLVAVVFTILNAFIFRVDEVRNPHELFAVERQRSANAEPESFTRPQYEALVRETGVFSDAFATTPDIDSLDRGPQDGGPARHGELLPRPRRQRRAWTHAHTVRRRARRPSGHCPQPSRLVPTFCERSRRAQPHGPAERRAVPRCRRDAGRLSRTRRSLRRTSGRRSPSLASSAAATQGREDSVGLQHRRAAEARSVARSGARAAPRVGLAARG